jgi:hypothetical protein
MTDETKEQITQAEIDAAIADGQRLRAEAIRDAVRGVFALFTEPRQGRRRPRRRTV